MSKQILIIFTTVALLASCCQSVNASTLISSGDCAGNREYKDLALNQTKKTTRSTKTTTTTRSTQTTKTSKTTVRAQTKKVERPSSWDLGYMMMGRYEYCVHLIEVDNMNLDISLYKNGISLTALFSNSSSDAAIPTSAKLTVGEDVFVVKRDGDGQYSLNVTNTATVNKIISSIATGNCIIKFDNGQQNVDFPATGQFAKDINQAYEWMRSNPYGVEL
jgi:hypothetical protein